MNLLPRCCFPLIASAAVVTMAPLGAWGQDAAAAKTTFDAVNKHLDLGGQFYVFLNIQGDFAQLATKAQELYGQFSAMEGVDLPAGLDLEAIFKTFGLENLEAVGMSSIKFGQGFRNRFFAAVDGEREGVLRLSGGDPRPFELGNFAPANAVWATEWDLDLTPVKDLMRGIGPQLQPVLGMDPISGVLQQPIPGTQLNVSQLLDTLTGNVLAYVTVDETQNLNIPDPNAPEIPGIDLVISHGNGAEIFGHIRSFVTSNAPPQAYAMETVDGVTQLKILLPPDASLGFYAPLIQFDEGDGQLLIATRPEALQGVTEGPRLAANADFKRTADLLPKEGNGYAYYAPEMYEHLKRFMQAASGPANPAFIAELQAEIMKLVYGQPQPTAAMWANWEDGIYSESIAPMSLKVTAVYAAVLPAIVSAAVIAPMGVRAARIQEAQQRAIRENGQP